MKGIAVKASKFLLVTATGLLLPQVGFGVGQILVFCNDSSKSNAPPPGAIAILDGGTASIEFGASYWVMFPNVTEGVHTVEVVVVENGYLPRQSPTDPNAMNDPYSEYGRPQYVDVVAENHTGMSGFLYDPTFSVTGEVRDAWTMERIEGAAIEFVFEGTTGPIATTKYPSHASYASNWVSDAEGYFPTNTILYLHDYDLNIIKSGYQLFTWNDVITNASPGDSFDLGTLFLQPIDANSNQIADAWEADFFGAGSNVVAEADADQDGMSNYDEYVAGTDPTNWNSRLDSELIITTNIFNLVWNSEPDRSYRVCGTTNLLSDTWVQLGGTWEATNGQTNMFWAETNHHLSWNNRYRIEVVPFGWQGTNQILIRTNDWPTSGIITNGTGGPPLP